jgi:hypothetical protein
MHRFSPLGRGIMSGQYKSINDFAENDARRNYPRLVPIFYSSYVHVSLHTADLWVKILKRIWNL